jgi:toxin YoeB
LKVVFDPEGWSEYLGWQQADAKVLQRINVLIPGWWSRRITGEHRLVYRVRGSGDAQALEVLSC